MIRKFVENLCIELLEKLGSYTVLGKVHLQQQFSY